MMCRFAILVSVLTIIYINIYFMKAERDISYFELINKKLTCSDY